MIPDGYDEFANMDASAAPASEAAEPTAPKPIDWPSKAGRQPPQRCWFADQWLPAAPTLLSGMGGIGKTVVAQTLSTALVLAKPYICEIPAPLRVLNWLCEDSEDDVWRRQVSICQHFDVPIEHLADKLMIEAREGCDNTLLALTYGSPAFTTHFERLREQINDLQIDVFVIDNLAQVFGGNESDRYQATLFVNSIKGMVRGRPFAPIFIGHTARSEGSEYSGSAAWENACRTRWYLGSNLPGPEPAGDDEANRDVVYLAKRKANYSNKDHVKLRFVDGLFVPDSPAGLQFGTADRDQIAEQVVLKGFAAVRAMGKTSSDGASSPDYLPKQLLELRLQQGHAKKELRDAMNRLLVAGVFKRAEIGSYGNRNPRFGLVQS